MRGIAIALGAAIAAALSAAAAPPSDAGPGRTADPKLQADARDYGLALLQVIAHVEQEYVRPVSRADLAAAALTGLYEAVRQPVPPGIRQDVDRIDNRELASYMSRVRETLGDHDSLRGARALYVSLNAMPRALDPFCSVTGPRAFQVLDLSDGSPQFGLEFPVVPSVPQSAALAPDGMRLDDIAFRATRPSPPSGPMRITNVHPGSPAQKAGIQPGDLIVKIDGRPPEDPGYAASIQRLLPYRQGTAVEFSTLNRPVRLLLLRQGAPQPIELTIAPSVYRIESVFGVRRRLDDSWDFVAEPAERIGYIRLGLVQLHSSAEFIDALRSMRSPSLRGLILDLRWCPGGYLDPSASIARALLSADQQTVATQRSRNPLDPQRELVKPVNGDTPEFDSTEFPVVVLIGPETSGGGELIAAALQDLGRAAVAGQRTVGKASVQAPLDRGNIPFRITKSILVRPSGKNMARRPESRPEDDWGVRPDPGREIPASAELSRQLKAWSILQSLRPASSVEALPLDDPENDPQRQAAMQMLKGMIAK